MQVNLEDIDQIFDEIELREDKGVASILLSFSNLSMLAVIGLIGYNYFQLVKLDNKRID